MKTISLNNTPANNSKVNTLTHKYKTHKHEETNKIVKRTETVCEITNDTIYIQVHSEAQILMKATDINTDNNSDITLAPSAPWQTEINN